jgi:hypothetical protein
VCSGFREEERGCIMTTIEIHKNCIVSVWRKNGPSIMTGATPDEPFKMEFNSDDVVRIVVT